MLQSSRCASGLCLVATLAWMPANAEDRSPDKDWSVTVGAGVAAETGFYTGDGDDIAVFPYLSLSWKRLTLSFTDGLEFNVFETDTFEFSVNLGVRDDPDYPKSALFSGLKRDPAIELGFDAAADLGPLYAAFGVRADVSSEHDGYEIGFDLGKEFEFGSVNVDMSLGASFQDRKLSQYMYGVSQTEVAAGRAQYSPGGVLIPHIDITITKPLSDSVILGGFAGYEFLPSDVSNSPLVDEDGVGSVGMFLLKTF